MTNENGHASWAPALAWLVHAHLRCDCVLCLIPVTNIRCDQVTGGLDTQAYARSDRRDLEPLLERSAG